MKLALAILLGIAAVTRVSAADTILWRFEATYSPSVVNEARGDETDAHLPVHSFAVIQKEKSAHPAIKRVTVGPFIVRSAESERRMKKVESLSAGDRVSIAVEASAAAFEEAEKRSSGELFVESDHIEIDAGKEPANQAIQPTPGNCPHSKPSQPPGVG